MIQTFLHKKFNIGELVGISQTTIEEHLKLYEGYVNSANKIIELIESDSLDIYAVSETRRRLGFEVGGIYNHEHYFSALSGGASNISPGSILAKKLIAQYGSMGKWKEAFVSCAKTRGVGWVMMYYIPSSDQCVINWVDEQHIGHMQGHNILVLAMDMWEHSYMLDYPPSKKIEYVDAFLRNINWTWIENNFDKMYRD